MFFKKIKLTRTKIKTHPNYRDKLHI